MTSLRLLSVLLGAACLTPSPVLAQAAARPQTIQLFQSSNRVLVMLKIGDHPPMPAVFDTGTNGNLVDVGVAERLDLPNRGGSVSVDGSTGLPVPGFETFIAGASLGGVPIDDARATAFAFDFPNEVAIVGPNSFPGRFVVLDLGKSVLRILPERPESTAGDAGFPYLGEDGAALPSLTLDIDGRLVPAILDTGNDSDFLLPLSMAADLALEAPPVVTGQVRSAAGTQPVYEARLAGDVTVSGIVIARPRARFIEGGRPNIGLPLLKRLAVMFDPVGERTWVLNRAQP